MQMEMLITYLDILPKSLWFHMEMMVGLFVTLIQHLYRQNLGYWVQFNEKQELELLMYSVIKGVF